jgi:hypothetical protein
MVLMTPRHRLLIWTLLGLASAALCWVVFRGYLSADMLMNFANAFYC